MSGNVNGINEMIAESDTTAIRDNIIDCIDLNMIKYMTVEEVYGKFEESSTEADSEYHFPRRLGEYYVKSSGRMLRTLKQ
jgi:hypothetical protein